MFSNAIKLENLNDYYKDGEECIKPFLYNSDNVNKNNIESPNLININKKNKKNKKGRGEISLTDCLACSGCVTNEETNFLKSQKSIEILNNLKKKKINIISLSLQSLTALSVYYNLPLSTTQNKLCFFFKSINFNYVYDSSLSELIALNEAKKEFIDFFYKNNPELCKQMDKTIMGILDNNKNENQRNREFKYTSNNSNEKLKKDNKDTYNKKHYTNKKFSNYSNYDVREKQDYNGKNYNNHRKIEMNNYQYKRDYIENESKASSYFPLICSHCSGSVIYGEKNFDEELLNSFSKIRTSQDIQGILLKFLHLHNGLCTSPLIKSYFFNNFFKLYNLKFIDIFRKYFLKNNNFFKGNMENSSSINEDDNKLVKDSSLTIYDINHVYLLYCFDKKIEAHKINGEQQKSIDTNIDRYISQFFGSTNISNNHENGMNINSKNKFYCVDAVLTTIELIELIKSMNIDFYALPELSIDSVYDILKETNYKAKIINKINCKRNKEKNKDTIANIELEKEKQEKDVTDTNIYNMENENILNLKEKNCLETLEQDFHNIEYYTKKNIESIKFIYENISSYSIRCSDKNNISMGYGEEIFKFVCKEIFNFNIEKNNFNLKYEDIIVLSLFKNNSCIFRVVLSYGFKSMYKVVRKLKEKKIINEIYENNMQENNNYEMKITYNLNFNGRIDYVELMACEKGCLFGCAQNIFSEYPQKFSLCGCHNFNIFKKINNQKVIENFDFLFSDNCFVKEQNICICSNEIHKKAHVNKKKNNDPHNEKEKDTNEALIEKVDKEKLFENLYETMHNNKFTLYVNSNKCTTDSNVNFFLKNIFYIFNTNTFHIFRNTFSSKKKLDIINW